jgi:tetratricopeptide (TPR) repeat protein
MSLLAILALTQRLLATRGSEQHSTAREIENTAEGIGIFLLFVLATGVFRYTSVLIHEMGHVVAGFAVRWKPVSLSLGFGKRRTILTIGDVDFQIGSRFLGGLVVAFAKTPKFFRLARFIFALGGPVATAFVAGLLLVLYAATERSDVFEPFRVAISIFFFIECFSLFWCLWPRMLRIDGMDTPNDGLLMWRSLTIKRKETANHYAMQATHLSKWYLERARIEEAFLEVEKVFLHSRPQSTYLEKRIYWIHLLLATARRDMVQAECDGLLAGDPRVTECRSAVLDSLACLPLYYGHLEFTSEALQYIDAALQEEPDRITLKGTKGALLLETGKITDGMLLLEEVQANSNAIVDREMSAYYLALGHSKQGETAEAMRMLFKAKEDFPNALVAARIEAEIRRACDGR